MNFLYEIITTNTQELVLLLFILIGIILSVMNNEKINKFSYAYGISAIICVLFSTLYTNISFDNSQTTMFTTSNIFTITIKTMILFTVFMLVIFSKHFIKEINNKSYEFYILLFTGALGGNCLVISNDFITSLVSIEMIGLSCYLLSGITKTSKALEGALKYLIQSSVATAIFLFGVSYIYGLSGSINFTEIFDYITTSQPVIIYQIMGIITLSGLMFKLGCIPFTNWIPDIYEGTSYPVGVYISLIPKIAAFGFLARILNIIFPQMPLIVISLEIIALISVCYAALGAIRQTNIKRLLGYSSILQSGFILAAITLTSVYSLSTVVFYLITYIFMNIGIWCAAYQFNLNTGSDLISSYQGLYKKRPYFTLATTICLVSLAGLPITSGFLGKIYLFSAIMKEGIEFCPVLFLLLIGSLISIFAYFSVIKNMYISSAKLLHYNFKYRTLDTLLYICVFITILICFIPNPLVNLSQIAAYYIK